MIKDKSETKSKLVKLVEMYRSHPKGFSIAIGIVVLLIAGIIYAIISTHNDEETYEVQPCIQYNIDSLKNKFGDKGFKLEKTTGLQNADDFPAYEATIDAHYYTVSQEFKDKYGNTYGGVCEFGQLTNNSTIDFSTNSVGKTGGN